MPGTVLSIHTQVPTWPHSSPWRQSALSPLSRWRDWGSKRLSSCCKVSQLVSGGTRIQTQICLTPKPMVCSVTHIAFRSNTWPFLQHFVGPSLNSFWSQSVYLINLVWIFDKESPPLWTIPPHTTLVYGGHMLMLPFFWFPHHPDPEIISK